MFDRKKSKTNSNAMVETIPIESGAVLEQKIEIISSSDSSATNPISELQSEIEFFDAQYSESNASSDIVRERFDEPIKIEQVETEKIGQIEDNKTEYVEEPIGEPVGVDKEKVIETIKTELTEVEKIDQSEKSQVNPEVKKKSKAKSPKKSKSKSSEKKEIYESESPDSNESEITKSKGTKKSKAKLKTKEPQTNEDKEAIVDLVRETKTHEVQLSTKPGLKDQVKEIAKKEIKEEIIDINSLTQSISDQKIQASVLTLYNENAELKANLQKAKKIIAILKKKLDLVEEKEEQWRACAHNLGDIFAEKSHMPLEDVLRRFEAPLDDALEESSV